jgi:hypothetical protein
LISTPKSLSTPFGGTVIGNAGILEQPSIPHLARAYLDKRTVTTANSEFRFKNGNIVHSENKPQLDTIEHKSKNYHPDTLLKKLERQRSKHQMLMTLAATQIS